MSEECQFAHCEARNERLTESSTVEVDEHRQAFSLSTTTTAFATSLATATTAMVLSFSWSPDAQLETVLADIASSITALQTILEHLVEINAARISVEVLHTAGTNLLRLNIFIRL